MFTGLIESTATVLALHPRSGGATLALQVGAIAAEVALGDSVAVNGCCLTATSIDPVAGTLAFDLLEQTLRVTSLGDLVSGSVVNIERAMRAGDRFGGHFVQGHVDDTVNILTWQLDGTDHRLEVSLPTEAHGLVIPKGSICLDGISLTAAEVKPDRIVCWIIPHTHEVTHLHTRQVGQRMNVEWDMLGKHVKHYLEAMRPATV